MQTCVVTGTPVLRKVPAWPGWHRMHFTSSSLLWQAASGAARCASGQRTRRVSAGKPSSGIASKWAVCPTAQRTGASGRAGCRHGSCRERRSLGVAQLERAAGRVTAAERQCELHFGPEPGEAACTGPGARMLGTSAPSPTCRVPGRPQPLNQVLSGLCGAASAQEPNQPSPPRPQPRVWGADRGGAVGAVC